MSALALAPLVADDFGDHMGDGWWAVMMIGMLLFWALVALAVVWAVRSLAGHSWGGSGGGGGSTALELLDRRLADGSISVEEYEQRRRLLLGEQAQEGR